MSFLDKLLSFFRKGGNTPIPPLRTDDGLDADTWRPIPRDYSQIDALHRPASLPATKVSAPGHLLPTTPPGSRAASDVTQLRATPKRPIVTTEDVQSRHVTSSTKEVQLKSTRCPHGKRRREFCPVCDPDGYAYNFGDWTKD